MGYPRSCLPDCLQCHRTFQLNQRLWHLSELLHIGYGQLADHGQCYLTGYRKLLCFHATVLPCQNYPEHAQ